MFFLLQFGARRHSRTPLGGLQAAANPAFLVMALVLIVTSFWTVNELRGEDWPRWRGPRGDGTWRGPKLPDTWPANGLKRVWRNSIGGGYGGISVVDDRVFVMDRRKSPEAERVLCFDASSGELKWERSYAVEYGDLDYGNGPRTTPTIHGNRVFTLGAVGHVHCLNAETGEVLWRKDFTKAIEKRLPMWGLAGSPVVHGDNVILHVGAKDNGCLIAVRQSDGGEVWRAISDKAGYATPVVIHREGIDEVVCWTEANVHGVNAKTGAPRWSIPFKSTYGVAIATPIYREGLLFVSGYWEGSKAIQFSPKVEVVWTDNRVLRGLMSQPLYRDGYVYLLEKRYGLTCFELKTGKKLWDDKNQMTPRGRNPQATMVWLGDEDRIIALNSDGELVLARLSPEKYEEQSRTKIIGETWAHPAYAGGRVFARSDKEIVCVSLTQSADTKDQP